MLTKTNNITRKEYKRLILNLASLKKMVLELTQDELKTSVIRKLTRFSKDLDKGLGRKFIDIKDFRSYLRRL